MTGPRLICVLVLAGLLQPGAAPESRLLVRVDGRSVWTGLVQPGEPFEVTFEHSAEHCTWIQQFVVDGSRIRQVASRFPCVGAGMPVGPSLEWSATGGLTAAAPQLLASLQIMNWTSAHIRLVYRGRIVPIGTLAADFQVLELSVSP
jgi:hypothetical protein